MSELDTDAMRQKLLELREQLEAVAESAGQSSAVVELDQSRVGRLSRMDAMQAQAMAQASEQRRAATQARIVAALARIDRGDYGICKDCEEPIDPRRLDFDPTVEQCIDCASNNN